MFQLIAHCIMQQIIQSIEKNYNNYALPAFIRGGNMDNVADVGVNTTEVS